jgi:uncharacterized protein (TIGR02646 family)
MRSIKQTREPLALRQWKRQNEGLPDGQTYPPPGNILQVIKDALHKEQMGLCAYTLRKLPTPLDGHVEHIVPQRQQPEKVLDYANMVLCFPPNGGDTSFGYGAPVKGGRHVQLNVDFVSPHSKGCDKRFIYKSNGEILPVTNDAAAEGTIHSVQLNCESLRDLRQAAIAAQGLTLRKPRTTRRQVRGRTVAEANRLASDILKPDANGELDAFCIAINQVALSYARAENIRSKSIAVSRKK